MCGMDCEDMSNFWCEIATYARLSDIGYWTCYSYCLYRNEQKSWWL